jgi:hypothetical protein
VEAQSIHDDHLTAGIVDVEARAAKRARRHGFNRV